MVGLIMRLVDGFPLRYTRGLIWGSRWLVKRWLLPPCRASRYGAWFFLARAGPSASPLPPAGWGRSGAVHPAHPGGWAFSRAGIRPCVATADAFDRQPGCFGLTLAANFLVSQQNWLRLGGGLFLPPWRENIPECAIRRGRGRPPKQPPVGCGERISSPCGPTWTNPLTILSFVAIFAGLGLAETGGDLLSAGILVLGVFSGLAAWWCALWRGEPAAR